MRSEVEAGKMSEAAAAEYRQDLKAHSDDDNFFFCVNRFLFTAVVGA